MLSDVLKADLILLNGNVLCMDAKNTKTQAVAVKRDKIIATGSDDEITDLRGNNTRVIDLAGRTLLPGFIEGHVHAEWYGRHQTDLNFKDCKSKEEILTLLKKRVDETKPGEWVSACAVPISIMAPGASTFTLQDIDSVSPNNPVAIDCASTGHCMLVNSQTMKIHNISKDHYPDGIWDGDGIVRDESGAPTGKLEGHAWNWALRAIKPYTVDWYLQALQLAQEDLLKVGITAAHNAWEDPFIFKGWQTLEQQEKLRVRTYISPDIERFGDLYIDSGMRTGFGTDMLKIMCLKIILNVPPRAAMLEDYCCPTGGRGYHLYPPDWVNEKVLHAVQNGWSVAAHSTGDADTDMLLTAYEQALAWYKKETGKDNTSLRLRLEHTMIVTDELIERIAASKIVVNARPSGRLSPGDKKGGPHEKMLGTKRWSKTRPLKPFFDRGVSVNFGCDYPAACGFFDPCASIFAASGGLGEPWDMITRQQTLEAYTSNGAFGVFSEDKFGSIEAGKFADLAVFSQNPLTIPVEEIWDPLTNTPVNLFVDYTIVGGKVEYQRH